MSCLVSCLFTSFLAWERGFSLIDADSGDAKVASSDKEIQNYKLQYNALKAKMHTFSNVRFIVWTGAVQCNGSGITVEQAIRMKTFVDWVRKEWDETGDNIYIWDFYYWEIGGKSSLYLLSDYQKEATNSHPDSDFNNTVYPYFCQRVVNVIKGNGDSTSIRGN